MQNEQTPAAGPLLLPCPFCGGEAEIIHLDDDDNAGGSCVCCTKCQASGNVEFGRKENFVENWNRRAHPSPTPAADADRVRIAVEDIQAKINAPLTGPTHGAWDRGRIAGLKEALAALKSEGK
jgi:Lar family restriction alleviation protein